MSQNQSDLAPFIDHTLLKADATAVQIEKLCGEAREAGFFSVCINPYFVPLAAKGLAGSGVKVCTVVGFPLGANLSETKASECEHAIALGADEIDMVINIGALKSGNQQPVHDDIAGVVAAAQSHTVKVILETCLLTNEEKILACKISQSAGASFVKTSSGFAIPSAGPNGATVDDVRLMRATVGETMGVKASGGIRDLSTAQAMIAAGANRLGTSSGLIIVQMGSAKKGDY